MKFYFILSVGTLSVIHQWYTMFNYSPKTGIQIFTSGTQTLICIQLLVSGTLTVTCIRLFTLKWYSIISQ